MKTIFIVGISFFLGTAAIAADSSVCGKITKIDVSGPNSVEFADGTKISNVYFMSEGDMPSITTAMASGLTVCFTPDSSILDRYYLSSIAK